MLNKMSPSVNDTLFVFYGILIPVIAIFGFVGNGLVLYILIRSKKHSGSAPVFSGFMYSYMKALSLSDMAFLFVTFQYCYAVAKHYLLTKDYIEPSSRAMEVYVWRLITPTWNLCCCVSDMIIVAMTVDRFSIMKNINQIGASEIKASRCCRRKSCVRENERCARLFTCLIPGRSSRMYIRSKIQAQILAAAAICLLMNIPYYFNYQIRECHDTNAGCDCTQTIYNQEDSISVKMSSLIEGSHIYETKSPIDPLNSIRLTNTNTTWIHCYTDFSKTILWQVWYIVYEILLKAIPTFTITALNILLFLKLRKIWKQRRELKKAMRTEVIPVIATPSMNHRVIMSKDLATVSASDDQDDGYVSSGKSLRYSARLKVPALKTVSCNPTGSVIDGRIENGTSPRTSMTSLCTPRASPLTSSSSYSSSANVDPSNVESLTTISHLLVQPSLPGADPFITKEHFSKVLRMVGLKRKPKKRKCLIFNIPSKTTLKELKMTFLLLSLVVTHIILTLPINITLFYWTYYPDKYAAMDDENRVLVSSMADTFRVVNYSLNFYLYCVANDDIRKAAYSIIANSFCYGRRV